MSVELRIKLEHIGMEPAIIRKHEARIKRKLEYHRQRGTNEEQNDLISKRVQLAQHRRWNVRNEIRATNLALAFIKGVPYKNLERNVKEIYKRNYYITPRVVQMVMKYHPDYKPGQSVTVMDAVNEWMSED